MTIECPNRTEGFLRGAALWAAAVAAGLLLTPGSASAQGCVAARGSGVCSAHGLHLGEDLPPTSGFMANVSYRWLHSDRHFVGDEEQKERQREGSEVINDSHFTDISLTYAINPRFSATFTVPFVVHDRSQVVRDTNRVILGRFHTQSAGIGDVRLEGNGWILDPKKAPKHNLLLGVGLDMPTGEKDAKDTFQVYDRNSGQVVAQERNVDQSIQPGDGGWGVILSLYGYRQLIPRLNAFVNGSYTITPEEKNGVLTRRTNPYESVMSIADSYFGRAGLEYVLVPTYGLTLSLAGRIEGVPVYDAIGGSEGFRRPGFSIGIEPGVMATIKDWSFGAYAPVALYRNRERSVPDKQWTESSGTYRHGDAAFADYLLMFSLSKRF